MGYDLSYDTLAEVVAAAEAADARLSDVVLAHEAEALEMGKDELFSEMAGRLRVMDECIDPGCAEGLRSPSGLTGGDAHREREAVRSGRSLVGGVVGGALYRALAVSELNAAMGRIVAAPTAGSCGILPAAVLTMREEVGASERGCVMSLFTAAGVGLVIERNASLAGAEGGCQAECGSAAAMAAAAVVELAGGTPAQAADAVSIAIQSMLGLVCDPVAGLVEVPASSATPRAWRWHSWPPSWRLPAAVPPSRPTRPSAPCGAWAGPCRRPCARRPRAGSRRRPRRSGSRRRSSGRGRVALVPVRQGLPARARAREALGPPAAPRAAPAASHRASHRIEEGS